MSNLEERLKETLQGKSHQFVTGRNHYSLSFSKLPDGSIAKVEFSLTGAESEDKKL